MNVPGRRKPIREKQHTIDVGGRSVPLLLRHHPRARRLILKIDAETDGAVVTIPPGTTIADGLEMAKRQSDWIVRQLDGLPRRVPFEDGRRVPFMGQDLLIRHMPASRGTVWIVGDTLCVAGQAEHLARRLTDWMKRRVRQEISAKVEEKAARIQCRAGRISIRDTRTRWGSCTEDGGMSFSWRLVMTPGYVLDYVVAHEVAHLVHMDHGARFWSLVEDLAADMKGAKHWIDGQGATLHRIG